MVANLEEVLTGDIVTESDFVNTEHLITLVVIVPKNEEDNWLSKYQKEIGSGLAGYGEAGNRQAKTGSPVVPGSARKLLVKDESVLYTVTLLRGQYQAGFKDEDGQFQQGVFNDFVEPFIADARKYRFVARQFTFNPSAMEDSKKQTMQLTAEEKRLYTSMMRWCSAHFGEAFIAWMHVKAIRAFVESVLRYGLPVNFTSVLYKPHASKTKRLHDTLGKMYAHLQGADLGEDDDGGPEFHPYYFNTVKPFSC
jgi:V-type H+-transporting ATPase subunit C